MSPQGESLFHFRPMFSLAAGFCLGIALSESISGTWLYIAPCLFLCFFGVALYLGLRAQALFALAMALGLLRPMLGPISLPPAVMAPFQRTRSMLLAATASLFGEQGPILQAMLWGYKSDIPDLVYSAYRDSGIAHVLALSGLHISFVASVIDWLARKRRPRTRFCTAAVIFFTYCAVAAFPASLVRASVMSLCSMYARVIGRQYDLASGISLSALMILLFDPSALFDVGFQLSFGAVAAIAMLMPALSQRLAFFPDSISSLVSVSVCGTLGTLPLSVYYFGTVPVLGLFANVLIMPIVPFAFVSALLVCLLSLAAPVLAGLLSPIPIFFTGAMSSAAALVSSVSFAVREAAVTPLCCAFIYAAYFCLSDYPLAEKKRKLAGCAACLAMAAACLMLA